MSPHYDHDSHIEHISSEMKKAEGTKICSLWPSCQNIVRAMWGTPSRTSGPRATSRSAPWSAGRPRPGSGSLLCKLHPGHG